MSRQVIILAAGKGTRMGATIPKVLIPLRGKPVILYLLEEVNQFLPDNAAIVVVGFQHELVEQTLGSKYTYALQVEQKGTAHAVAAAQAFIKADNFIVLYGDMPFITATSLAALAHLHESSGAKLSMFTALVPSYDGVYEHFSGFGRIIRDATGRIVKIQEYVDCTEEQKAITEVNPGIYMFNSDWLWKHMGAIGDSNAQQEYYLTDIVEIAITDNQSISSLVIAPEEIYGINTPDHLAHAQTILEN